MSRIINRATGFALVRDLLDTAASLSKDIRKIAMPVLTSAYIASMGRPSPTLSFMLAVAIELGGRLGITLGFSYPRSRLHMEHGGLSALTGTLSRLGSWSWCTVSRSVPSSTLARMRRSGVLLGRNARMRFRDRRQSGNCALRDASNPGS
jgi:hypothetical protein